MTNNDYNPVRSYYRIIVYWFFLDLDTAEYLRVQQRVYRNTWNHTQNKSKYYSEEDGSLKQLLQIPLLQYIPLFISWNSHSLIPRFSWKFHAKLGFKSHLNKNVCFKYCCLREKEKSNVIALYNIDNFPTILIWHLPHVFDLNRQENHDQ